MAKEGIDSFLLDCHTNDNIAEIEAVFSIKGFAVLVRLWQKIYAEKGYYCEWSERSPLLFLSQWFGGNSGVDVNLINEIISYSLKICLFNRELYDKYKILTSERIQSQYFDVVKRRTEIKIIKEYLLISIGNFKGNVNIISIYADKNEKIVSSNSASKGNISKDNVSKEKGQGSIFLHPDIEEVKKYCSEQGFVIDCEKFVNHYNSVGWQINGSPLVDWKARVKSWHKEDREKDKSNGMRNVPRGVFNNYDQKIYSKEEIDEILKRKAEGK